MKSIAFDGNKKKVADSKEMRAGHKELNNRNIVSDKSRMETYKFKCTECNRNSKRNRRMHRNTIKYTEKY